MKAILYAAKSTEDVHGSIETQLADCRALAEREGWGVVEDYQDEAASAYKGNRGPGLAAALDCVERIGGTLIVQHSDRLARGDGKRAQHLTRQRTYVCGHVQDFTGLCHAPRIDAELVDTHVINGLQRYLGDFEAWLEQLLSGYASERHRLGRDLRNALRNCEEQERICERIDRAIGLAETDAEAKAAMRAAGAAHEELERRQRRSRAAQDALDGVPQRSTGRCHARLLQRAERRDPRQTGGGRHTRPG
jgi:hypothetical protein